MAAKVDVETTLAVAISLSLGPIMIYISCQFETPIGRPDYSDYVRALQVDVTGYDAVGNRVRLGMIAADQVLIGDAQVD
jgi:hypothetical protein